MGAAANPNRQADIRRAMKKAKPGDLLSLAELAFVWGTTKGPFVTTKKNMTGMPEPKMRGNEAFYPAAAALKAMLNFETRNDAAASARAERTSQILGGMRKSRASAATSPHLPVRDLAVLNRMAAEIEQRERDQREYIPASEVAAVAAEVFSGLSEFVAGLSNAIDPNGLLDPRQRAMIDDNGSTALLKWHKAMKHILDADVDVGAPRKANGRAGRPPARRQRA